MTCPNHVILLTPPSPAAIAVVRLCGPAVPAFLHSHVSRPVAGGRCVHASITDAARILDDAVIVYNPNQQYVDLSLHGGPWIVRSILDLAQRQGFTLVSDDPSAHDASTLLDLDVLSHLPHARTELALRALLHQRTAWRAATLPPAEQILHDYSLFWLLNPPQVAIVGPPNVGKSTLANQLFARERSITADLPGTTRDWVGELANIDGLTVMLVDTPGLRDTADPIEQQAIERSATVVRQADLVILVLDVMPPLDQQLSLIHQHPAALRVANKSDQPQLWDPAAINALPVAALTGHGMDELRRQIRRHFHCDPLDPPQPRWWTERQRQVLKGGVDALRNLLLATP